MHIKYRRRDVEGGRSVANERMQFPAFRCPNPACGARRIFFAANRAEKNRTRLFLYDRLPEGSVAEFVIVCPKCRQRIAVCRTEDPPPRPVFAT